MKNDNDNVMIWNNIMILKKNEMMKMSIEKIIMKILMILVVMK